MEPNLPEIHSYQERLIRAENEILNFFNNANKVFDYNAWRRMVQALPELMRIIKPHAILKDRKSIFALIACYLGYTEGSDIHMTKGQAQAAYLLIWVMCGQSKKGKSPENKEKTNDTLPAAMKRSISVIQKYFKRRKGTSPMVVYYHEEFNASVIVQHEAGSEQFLDALLYQMARIPPRDKERARNKRPASEECEGQSPTKRLRSSESASSDVSSPDSSDLSTSDPSPRDVPPHIQLFPFCGEYVHQVRLHPICDSNISRLTLSQGYPPYVPNVMPPQHYDYSNAGTSNTNQEHYTNYSYVPPQNVPDNIETNNDTYQPDPIPNQYWYDENYPPQESTTMEDTSLETEIDHEYELFMNWLMSECEPEQYVNRCDYLTSMYESITDEYDLSSQ